MKDKIKTVAVATGVLGLLGFILFKPTDVEPPPPPAPICTNVTIPFERIEDESDELEIGDSEITQDGIDGEKEVCTTSGVISSQEILLEPTNEITTIGTAEPYIETYTSTGYRTGAECWDGWYSSATGSGACSYHGGVYQWVY